MTARAELFAEEPIAARQGRPRSLAGLLPSVTLHGAFAVACIAGFSSVERPVAPTVSVSLVAAPSQPAPDLPLPATGLRLPSTPPATQPPELPLPATPETAAAPYDLLDMTATRPAPEPVAEEPAEAVPLEPAKPKPPVPPKLTADDKPKPKPKLKEAAKTAKAKTPAKPQAPAQTAPSTPAANPQATAANAAATSPASPAPATQAPTTQMPASDAPVRVTNPDYAGACPIRYPERARRRNQQGTVVVQALIGTDGKPISVTVVSSSGHELLDVAAQAAIENCAFVPQSVGGRAVRTIVEIPIPFKLI